MIQSAYEPINVEPIAPKPSSWNADNIRILGIVGITLAAVIAAIWVLIFVLVSAVSGGEQLSPRAVLVLGLDGLSASVFTTADAANLRKLARDGVSATVRTHNGNRFGSAPPTRVDDYQSPYEWVTGPGWCSVITGVDNSRHLVRDNTVAGIRPFAATSKLYPTMFASAQASGRRTAASGDYGFISSVSADGACLPGVVDYECDPPTDCDAVSSCNLNYRQSLPESSDEDNKTTAFITAHVADADLLFAHFVGIDVAGHKFGWGSREQLRAITVIDELVGQLITHLLADRREWLIIATADHGGFNMSHGTNWNADEFVPLIIATKNWAARLRNITAPATHMDVAPTVLQWLGIPLLPYRNGLVQAI